MVNFSTLRHSPKEHYPKEYHRTIIESEIVMLHYGLFTPKKRGRPAKYDVVVPQITNELRKKRERFAAGAINLAGTMMSLLLKESYLDLHEAEALHKIFLLRKRYLSVVGLRLETKSQFSNLFMPKGKDFQRVHVYEDSGLEECWRSVASILTSHYKNAIILIDKLFAIHPYDDLQGVYTRFIKEEDPAQLPKVAKACEIAWGIQRKI